MTATSELAITSERCSTFRQGFNADPAGSAGQYDAFLCIEVPLPWLRDISLHEPFVSLGKLLNRQPGLMPAPADGGLVAEPAAVSFASLTGQDGRVWRPQGLVPSSDVTATVVRVLAFELRQPLDADGIVASEQLIEFAAPFERREWLLEPADVLPLTQALISGNLESVARFEPQQVQQSADVIDLLICTHGKRDVCCGQSGTALYSELSAAPVPQAVLPTSLDAQTTTYRLWRTSHTGGHRFAPTALSFPDGYAWAYLDAAASTQILQRPVTAGLSAGSTAGLSAGSTAGLAEEQLCRGVSSLSCGVAQVADVAALRQVGWAWASAHRSVQVVGFDRKSMATKMLVQGTLPDSSTLSFLVQVELDSHIPQITCGAIESPEYNVEAVWKVASILQV
ncbi:MAG: sucrase ferredoxin [Microthrixaceae bacterium]